MKNLKTIAGALLLGSVLFGTSCSKVTTEKKLDGKWTITAGTATSSYETENYKRDTEGTYDGSEWEYETTESYTGGTSTVTTSDDEVTYEYTFDKKNGTYIFVETRTTSGDTTRYGASYYLTGADSVANGQFNRITSGTYTRTTEGTFSLTGGTGEIEANSQLVMMATKYTENSTLAHSYVDASTGAVIPSITSYYYVAGDDEDVKSLILATESEEETGSYQMSTANVYTIESTEKKTMTVKTFNNFTDETVGNVEERKNEQSLTFTKAE